MAQPVQVSESWMVRGKRRAIFKCPDCLFNYETQVQSVKHGKSTRCKSCAARKKFLKHGMSSDRLYQCWSDMKQRCNNPKSASYEWYGARGISVCAEWEKSFDSFRQWAESSGYSKELTIDRIDSSKNYDPKNCRWSCKKEQSCNQGKRKKNKSGFIGVFEKKGKWIAQIKNEYRNIYVGTYDDPVLAAQARDMKIKELCLPHRLNFQH